MMMKCISKNLTPLCFLPNGLLVCYKHGNIVVLKNGILYDRFNIFSGFKEKILGKSKIISRLLRLGIRTAIALDDNTIVLCYRYKIYELNLKSRSLSKGVCVGHKIRPLVFSKIQNVDGFDDSVVFGGYVLGNVDKEPVHVYKRIDVDKWITVFTFSRGAVNHIHNIVADKYRKCLWAFTGDLDVAAAIWKISDNFKRVEMVLGNNQKYRGCVAFPLPEGVLYATDAPFADNYLYLLNPLNNEISKIFPLHGSCIYGCRWKDKFIFSSSVEGNVGHISTLQFYFGRKRGDGIKDDFVHMYCGNLQEGFTEIYNEEKDNLPLYTFQFGVIKFPSGVNEAGTLFFQPIATKKNDLNLLTYTA